MRIFVAQLMALERMAEKTRGIVLHTLKYGDSSLIVDVYTESGGNVSFLVRTPRGRKASVRGVFFRPLTLLELDYELRPKASLQRIKDVRVHYAYRSLLYQPYKAAIALFLAEFLYRALRHETCNPPLFAYLYHSLQWLDQREGSFANFHSVFLLRLTRFLGFYPNAEEYHAGDFFDLQNACFVGRRPLHAACLPPEEAALIPRLMRMNYDTMHLFVFSRAERNRLLSVLNDYYRLHVPDFPELKSLDVLREVFS